MKKDERESIAKALEKTHYFFRAFWDFHKIVWDDEIQTAAISFDEEGLAIKMTISPKFWAEMDFQSRLFVIQHEMLHVVLNHGARFFNKQAKERMDNDPFFYQCANGACDLAINESLVRDFKININELHETIQKGWFVDTAFPDSNVPKNESSEYYLDLLLKNRKKIIISGFDSHEMMGGMGDPADGGNGDEIQDILDSCGVNELLDDMAGNEVVKGAESQSRSPTGTGGYAKVEVKKTQKRKWESVIKKWSIVKVKNIEHSEERWDLINRRFLPVLLKKNFKIPTENELDARYLDPQKILVFFFLDCSGSCYHLKNRFYNAAHSLPKDRFDVRLFSFDTQVQELDYNGGKIYGGGGTSFSIIERKIQSIVKSEKRKYPDSVWVITDGYGDSVTPEIPKNWHWFLSCQHISCIPKESKIYKLSDFE